MRLSVVSSTGDEVVGASLAVVAIATAAGLAVGLATLRSSRQQQQQQQEHEHDTDGVSSAGHVVLDHAAVPRACMHRSPAMQLISDNQ
jgi:hypothetical protein